MERAVLIYAIVNLAVIGISHVARPRAWVDFLVMLRERGEAGVFGLALLNLVFGSIVAAFHNVWTGVPLLLTLLGWASVAKALVYFAFPQVALRRLERLSPDRPWPVMAGGIAFLLLASLLTWHALRG
jgi:hypothetical protein